MTALVSSKAQELSTKASKEPYLKLRQIGKMRMPHRRHS